MVISNALHLFPRQRDRTFNSILKLVENNFAAMRSFSSCLYSDITSSIKQPFHFCNIRPVMSTTRSPRGGSLVRTTTANMTFNRSLIRYVRQQFVLARLLLRQEPCTSHRKNRSRLKATDPFFTIVRLLLATKTDSEIHSNTRRQAAEDQIERVTLV